MLWITPATGDAFGPVETALQDTFIVAFFHGVGEGIPDQGVAHLPVKHWVLPSQARQIRLPRTGQRPVLLIDILLQCSGASRSSGWQAIPPTFDRGWNRWGRGTQCGCRRYWRIPWLVPLSKSHAACGRQKRQGHGCWCIYQQLTGRNWVRRNGKMLSCYDMA